MAKALAGASAFGHNSLQAVHPSGRCSQGGVKVPTGGKGDVAQARERLLSLWEFLFGEKGQQIRCESEADG
jgi:hypothetical protein